MWRCGCDGQTCVAVIDHVVYRCILGRGDLRPVLSLEVMALRVNRERQLADMNLQELRQVLIRDIRKIPTARVKKMLDSYRYCQTRIDSNLDQIQVLRSRMQKVTTTYHDAPGGGSGEDVSDQIGKIVKLERYVQADTGRMQDELTLVRFLIDSLDEVLERQVLDLRYVRGWRNWEDIAAELHYSVIHMKRIHGIALKKLVPLVEEILQKRKR